MIFVGAGGLTEIAADLQSHSFQTAGHKIQHPLAFDH